MKTVPSRQLYRFEDLANAGDYLWATHPGSLDISSITFCCPCGCGDVVGIPVDGPKAWDWDRNEGSPTLTPSIRRLDGCLWHGYLTAGNFVEC